MFVCNCNDCKWSTRLSDDGFHCECFDIIIFPEEEFLWEEFYCYSFVPFDEEEDLNE